MEHKEFDIMLADEKTHWWYRARFRLVDHYLNAFFPRSKNAKILDMASACGANFEHYSDYGAIFGLDIAQEAIDFCRSKGVNRIVRGDAHSLPFSCGVFDGVFALDALEHFKDDGRVLKELFRVMKDNGLIFITAPAFACLWSQHDEAFHHQRRYSLREMKNKLNKAGYTIVFATYWSFLLFLPAFLLRKGKDLFRIFGKTQDSPVSDFHMRLPRWVALVLDCLAKAEALFIKRKISFPIGVSLFCVAKKTSSFVDRV
ncbi:MAG: class I SAM-dependent methyltransferase [Candidatus Omnitrophica bacterium]|nr:class I SAM-dependent methyltransferase [Candidatus Omnitrophota bacterium]